MLSMQNAGRNGVVSVVANNLDMEMNFFYQLYQRYDTPFSPSRNILSMHLMSRSLVLGRRNGEEGQRKWLPAGHGSGIEPRLPVAAG